MGGPGGTGDKRAREKKNHKGKARRVGAFDDIVARNADVPGNPQPKNRNPVDKDSDAESSSSEEETQKTQKQKPVQLKSGGSAGSQKQNADGDGSGGEEDLFACGSLNARLNDDTAMMAGGLTRKQKEEIEKERKRKA